MVSNRLTCGERLPNKALQLAVNPLRGLSAAELGRYVNLEKLNDLLEAT